MKVRVAIVLFPLFFALSVAAVQPAGAEPFKEHFVIEGTELELGNLIGEITLKGHNGSGFVIEADVRGDDAARDVLTFEVQEGLSTSFSVQYPVRKHSRFVYPPMGRTSKTTIHASSGKHRNGWRQILFPLMGKDKIKISGSGRGLEIWTDLTVLVPEGAKISVRHGVGRIDAEGLEGRSVLDTSVGSVTVRDMEGEIIVDTGSGEVRAYDVNGYLNVDTGSGEVSVARFGGETLLVDTGSGEVEAHDINCKMANIDTGSGKVRVHANRLGGANIDTGNGAVELVMERMGSGPFVIDTGNGAIDLCLPPNASVDLRADTGNGRISYKLPDAEIRRKDEDELALRIGDGDVRVRLDTGNGSIRIHH